MVKRLYTVPYGGRVTLECIVDSYPRHTTVDWYRVTDGVRATSPIRLTNNNEGSTVDSPSLTIKRADLNDGGSYMCSAENAAGVGYSDETAVEVTGGNAFDQDDQENFTVLTIHV